MGGFFSACSWAGPPDSASGRQLPVPALNAPYRSSPPTRGLQLQLPRPLGLQLASLRRLGHLLRCLAFPGMLRARGQPLDFLSARAGVPNSSGLGLLASLTGHPAVVVAAAAGMGRGGFGGGGGWKGLAGRNRFVVG